MDSRFTAETRSRKEKRKVGQVLFLIERLAP
jgi:hypothetical protein